MWRRSLEVPLYLQFATLQTPVGARVAATSMGVAAVLGSHAPSASEASVGSGTIVNLAPLILKVAPISHGHHQQQLGNHKNDIPMHAAFAAKF